MTKRHVQYWVIPPEANAEFVACMEEVLDVYARPYDPSHPVICMDEQSVQLVKETRQVIPATKEHPKRLDYEYERAGTASIFMFAEPLAGWREATAREYVRRIEFVYTPKHGSWLNISENELSCLTGQCLSDRRIGELCELQEEIGAWSIDVTSTQRGVDWQMKIDDAHCKLTSLYPKILL